MSKRNSQLLIADIQEAIEKNEYYAANLNKNEFFIDEKTGDAVVRNLEVIGEAAIAFRQILNPNTPILNGKK